MKLTKKIIALTMATCMIVSIMSGCGSSVASSSGESKAAVSSAITVEKKTIKIATLKGPSGLGMLKLMDDSDAKVATNNYEFTILSDPDEMVSKISSGAVDAASVPSNLAAMLYNKTKGKVQIATANTLGVLSILTNGENITSVKDLKGKTIYASGQGLTPEYVLNYVLKKNGLKVGQDVKVVYKAEHTELAALVASGKIKIAVLPEPFVTQVMAKNKDIKIALNITDEWNNVADDKSELTMGCLIVLKDFAKNNKDVFNEFLDDYKESIKYTNSSVEKAAVLSEKYNIMPAQIAKKAIPNCNIVYIDGDELKTKIPNFLKILFAANPKSVGGKLPGDDFYYSK